MSTAFQGNYSTDLFNASKRYRAYFQRGVALADSEIREMRDEADLFIRQIVKTNLPTGSSTNNGFKVIQSSVTTTNNFAVTGGDGTATGAGVLFVDGYCLFLKSNIEYNQQNAGGLLTDDDYTTTAIPSLTTPGGVRTDVVYVDFYFAEVSANAGSEYLDTSLIVSGIGSATANRVRQVQDIRVAEGGAKPADGNDGNGIYHRYIQIATLNRTASPAILTANIVDNRILVNSLYSYMDGTANTIKLVNGANIGDATHRLSTVYMASTLDYSSDLLFSSSGEKVRITTGGNLGLNSTSPATSLDIYRSGNAGVLLKSTTNTADLNLDGAAGAQSGNIYFKVAGVERFHARLDGTNDRLYISDDTGIPALSVTSAGRVGIGTNDPQHPLHIYTGTGTAVITGNLTVSGTTTTTQPSNLYGLQVNKNGSGTGNAVEIANNGTGVALLIGVGTTGGNTNVCIGTTTPEGYLVSIKKEVDADALQLRAENLNTGTAAASSMSIRAFGNNAFLRAYGDNHATRANIVELGSTATGSDVVLITNAAERVRISSVGYVGIGTDNPQNNLHLYNASTATAIIESGASNSTVVSMIAGSGDPQVQFAVNKSATPSFVIGVDNSDGDKFKICSTALDIANTKVVVESTGNVGIGTTIPLEILHVAGNVFAGTRVTAIASPGQLNATNVTNGGEAKVYFAAKNTGGASADLSIKALEGDFIIRAESQAVDRMVIKSSTGNVGIGTNNPYLYSMLEIMSPSSAGYIGSQLHIHTLAADNGAYLSSVGSGAAIFSAGAHYQTGGNWTAKYLNAASVRIDSTGDLVFNSNVGLTTGGTFIATERMRISAGTTTITGFLNTGTTTITGNLTVNGTTATLNTEVTASDKLEINQSAAQEALIVRKTSVGIGTAVYISNGGSGASMVVVGIGTVAVGIGTTTIGSALTSNNSILQVRGSVASSTGIVKASSFGTTNQTNIEMYATDATAKAGLFIPDATTSMVFSTNSAERMYINSTGNVGIGTVDPQTLFHTSGSSVSSVYNRFVNRTTAGLVRLQLAESDTVATDTFYIARYGSTTSTPYLASVWNAAAGDMRFGTTDSERMRITAAGLVGIGTTIPLDILHADKTQNALTKFYFTNNNIASSFLAGAQLVVGDTDGLNNLYLGNSVDGTTHNSVIKHQSTSAGHGLIIESATATGTMAFKTNSLERVTITGAGFVGIGTNNPQQNLHVYSASAGVTVKIEGGASNSAVTEIIAGTGDPLVKFMVDKSATPSFQMGVDNSDSDKFKIGTTDIGTANFVINSLGHVSIGTSSPFTLWTPASLTACGVGTNAVTSIACISLANTPTSFAEFMVRTVGDASAGISMSNNMSSGYPSDSPFWMLKRPSTFTNNPLGLTLHSGRFDENTNFLGLTTSGHCIFLGGNIGIGTTTPGETLSVWGDSVATGKVGVGTATAPFAEAFKVFGQATVTTRLGVGSQAIAHPFEVWPNTANAILSADFNGITIGSTAIGGRLTFRPITNSYDYWFKNTGAAPSVRKFILQSDNGSTTNEEMYFDSTMVGIGTTSRYNSVTASELSVNKETLSLGLGTTDYIRIDSGSTNAINFHANGDSNSYGRITSSTTQMLFRWSAGTRISMDATGLGFFGTTTAAKPTVTGSRGGNAALASLITALSNLGLLTDSTTA